MKKNKTELDVDFIGGQQSLTEQEARAISEYLKKNKAVRKNRSKKTAIIKHARVTA